MLSLTTTQFREVILVKLICRILAFAAVVMLFAAPASAVPWNVGDSITYSLSPPVVATPYGSGGLFTITNVNTGAVTKSFCIELNEHIYNGDRVAGISDSAVAGGRGGGSPDPISSATDWLFAQFATGNSAYGNTAALQLAFWFLEDEVYAEELTSWVSKGYFSADLLTMAYGYINDARKHNTGSYGTQVLNLMDKDGKYNHQSQLIRTAEPSTLLILGLGLVGVAGLRRKIK